MWGSATCQPQSFKPFAPATTYSAATGLLALNPDPGNIVSSTFCRSVELPVGATVTRPTGTTPTRSGRRGILPADPSRRARERRAGGCVHLVDGRPDRLQHGERHARRACHGRARRPVPGEMHDRLDRSSLGGRGVVHAAGVSEHDDRTRSAGASGTRTALRQGEAGGLT